MPVVLLRVPTVDDHPEDRPQKCPYCGSQILQRWGRVTRKIQDAESHGIEIYRYRCAKCERTFRGYPPGLDRSSQSDQLRCLATLSGELGLSSREVAHFFQKLGIDMSHVTVWRYGQEMLARKSKQRPVSSPRKYTLDKEFVRQVSPKFGVVILVDLGDGRYEVLGTVDEFNPREVKAWLERLLTGTEIQVSCLDTGVLNKV